MKPIILCALLLMLTITSFAQQTNPAPQLTKADYLKKYRTQKTVAWVLVGVGTVGFVYTLFSYTVITSISFGQSEANYTAPLLISGACIVGSIPLFSAAKKNLKHALNASASFKIEKTPLPLTRSHSYPAISVRIPL
jgi:hypothetical protein